MISYNCQLETYKLFNMMKLPLILFVGVVFLYADQAYGQQEQQQRRQRPGKCAFCVMGV